jgi:hypothetical protein
MQMTGATVTLVEGSVGDDVSWGLRPESAASEIRAEERLTEMIAHAGGDVVVGDSHLANSVIAERTGVVPIHPIQLMARSYGIPEDG